MSATAPTITECQQLLLAAGYSLGPDGADGKYGPASKAAVLKFQADRGLPQTGALDTATTTALFYPKETSMLATVKSAWLSKINWTVALGIAFNLSMFLGHPVPSDVQEAVTVGGNAVVLVAAWIIRTWFTTSITTASAAKAS